MIEGTEAFEILRKLNLESLLQDATEQNSKRHSAPPEAAQPEEFPLEDPETSKDPA